MTEAHNVRATISDRFGLTQDAIFRLLKTAIKDDEKLVDEAIAAVYDQMISFDRARADQVIGLIIRRHREAKDASRLCSATSRNGSRKICNCGSPEAQPFLGFIWRSGD
jgi:hypothetical protein